MVPRNNINSMSTHYGIVAAFHRCCVIMPSTFLFLFLIINFTLQLNS